MKRTSFSFLYVQIDSVPQSLWPKSWKCENFLSLDKLLLEKERESTLLANILTFLLLLLLNCCGFTRTRTLCLPITAVLFQLFDLDMSLVSTPINRSLCPWHVTKRHAGNFEHISYLNELEDILLQIKVYLFIFIVLFVLFQTLVKK